MVIQIFLFASYKSNKNDFQLDVFLTLIKFLKIIKFVLVLKKGFWQHYFYNNYEHSLELLIIALSGSHY